MSSLSLCSLLLLLTLVAMPLHAQQLPGSWVEVRRSNAGWVLYDPADGSPARIAIGADSITFHGTHDDASAFRIIGREGELRTLLSLRTVAGRDTVTHLLRQLERGKGIIIWRQVDGAGVDLVPPSAWIRADRAGELPVVEFRSAREKPLHEIDFLPIFTVPVQEVEQARIRALLEGRFGDLADFLSDDLVYTHSNGKVESKKVFLDALRSGAMTYRNVTHDSVRVREYGEIAILTGSSLLEVTAGGQPLDVPVRFTLVYRLEHGRWRMVSWQSTRR